MSDDTIVLYPFRKRDPVTGKWYRARWMASLEDIERLGGIVDGEPEIRHPSGPWRASIRTVIRLLGTSSQYRCTRSARNRLRSTT